MNTGLSAFFDYAAAGIGLAVTGMPVLATAAIMGRINEASPFYIQDRVGKDGKIFQIYKIRTLKDSFDEAGKPLPDHLRATAIGTFLRKTRIDELPQFINVLKGDMSIVGPRPGQPQDDYVYDPMRQTVLPGLLGASQVRLGRGHPSHEKLESDLEYIRVQSLLNDCKIIGEVPLHAMKRFRICDLYKPIVN